MAKKDAAKESVHTMSLPELQARLREVEESHFRLQFRHASSPLKNPMLIRQTRRSIARLKTALHQKEQPAAKSLAGTPKRSGVEVPHGKTR